MKKPKMNKINIGEQLNIKVNKVDYEVVKAEFDESKQSVIDANTENKITGGGVYMFVLNADVPNFDINKFNREVTGIFFDNVGPYCVVSNVPPYLGAKLKNEYLFYVGKSKGDLNQRIKEHWTCAKMTGNASLKLGFKSREWIREHLNIYVILDPKDNTMDVGKLESQIRDEYGSVFGK